MFRPVTAAPAAARRGLIALALAGLALTACEEAPKPPPAPEAPAAKEALQLGETRFEALSGWAQDRVSDAIPAFRRSCARLANVPPERSLGTPALPMTAADWTEACTALRMVRDGDEAAARAFFQSRFTPFRASDSGNTDGLFTGYFEAELTGSRSPSARFATPLYARPTDLVSVDLGNFDEELKGRTLAGKVDKGNLVPYPERREIEAGMLAGKGLELVWVDDAVDAFLLQVQGSGRVMLDDGTSMRLGFAGHNGRPYKSIGRSLIDRGALTADQASWDGIRGWLSRNPGQQADLFAVNPRFIFFRKIEGEGPIGAEGVALTAGRSLAVDRRYIPLRLPVWLETTWPGTTERKLDRLMVAQDTGGAIRGPVRGDFFWGTGDAALAEAGKMRSRGSYVLLIPNPAAARVRAAMPAS